MMWDLYTMMLLSLLFLLTIYSGSMMGCGGVVIGGLASWWECGDGQQ